MSVLQKLKDLKRVLDRNLATRSQDVLPVINECIKELEQEQPKQEEKPVKTVEKKEIKQEPKQEVIQVKVEGKKEEKKPTEQIEKEAKQFLKDNWVSNRKFLKWEKAVNKAIELGFNI